MAGVETCSVFVVQFMATPLKSKRKENDLKDRYGDSNKHIVK